MARLLFLVHGMGVHAPDAAAPWHEAPLKALTDAADRYGVRDRFDEKVEIHPITYDGVFAGHLRRLDRSVDELREVMERNAMEGLDVLTWLEDQDITDTEKSFFWSHVVDVLLYRFFPQVAAEVRARVLERFVSVVNAAESSPGPRPRVAILAHSLGTAVTHDALLELATRPFDGSSAFMASSNWRLHHLFTLANVSRVLSRLGAGFYHSTVRCQTAPEVTGVDPCIARYLNFRHRLDPIPAVKAFSPAGWGPDFVAEESLDHLLEWNVHGFTHYLRHPDVHVPILNALLDFPISEQQQRDAVSQLPAAPRSQCAGLADRLRVQLRRIRDLVRSPTVDAATVVDLIKAATATLALGHEMETDCKEILG